MNRKLRIALVGGGIGGLTAALALTRVGFEAHVFEQADMTREVGAGITLTPNAVKILRALGLEKSLASRGFEAEAIVGRDWISAQRAFRIPLKGTAKARFGAPHFDIYRLDLLEILRNAGADSQIHFNSRCVEVSSKDRTAVVTLSSGRQIEFDLVVGCDGIHSMVRTALHGLEEPRFTGNMCWRALVAAEKLPRDHVPPDVTIWVGPGGHVVTYYVRGRELVNVVAVRETTEWIDESWSLEAMTAELVAAFPGVHKDLALLLERVDGCFKWGLFDRDPLKKWSIGRITLLGDAAHPMLPFLGQGAAMAMEDAFVLARQLARSPEHIESALRHYEAERIPRTAQVQLAARKQANIFHLTSPISAPDHLCRNAAARITPNKFTDLKVDWLYDYDPTQKPA